MTRRSARLTLKFSDSLLFESGEVDLDSLSIHDDKDDESQPGTKETTVGRPILGDLHVPNPRENRASQGSTGSEKSGSSAHTETSPIKARHTAHTRAKSLINKGSSSSKASSRSSSRARLPPIQKDNGVLRLSPRSTPGKGTARKRRDWTPRSSPLKASSKSSLLLDCVHATIEKTSRPDCLPQKLFSPEGNCPSSPTKFQACNGDISTRESLLSEHADNSEADDTDRTSSKSPTYNPVSPCLSPDIVLADYEPEPFAIKNEISPTAFMTTPDESAKKHMKFNPFDGSPDTAFADYLAEFCAEKKCAQEQATSMDFVSKSEDSLHSEASASMFPKQFRAGVDVFSDPFAHSISLAAERDSDENDISGLSPVRSLADPFHDQFEVIEAGNVGISVCQLKTILPDSPVHANDHSRNDQSPKDDRHVPIRKITHRASFHDLRGTALRSSLVSQQVKSTHATLGRLPKSRHRSVSFAPSPTEVIDFLVDSGSDHICESIHTPDNHPTHNLVEKSFTEQELTMVKSGHARKVSLTEGIEKVKVFFNARTTNKRARPNSESSDVKIALPVREEVRAVSFDSAPKSIKKKRSSYLPRLISKASKTEKSIKAFANVASTAPAPETPRLPKKKQRSGSYWSMTGKSESS